MESNSLYHHGILGMKWGVRRFQNRDGTRTAAGKKRAQQRETLSDEELTSRIKRLSLEKQYAKLSKENSKPSKLDSAKKIVDTTSSLVNQAKTANREAINSTRKKERIDLSSMTDQQLRERITRENLERQYNDLFGKESVSVSKGQQYLSNVLEVGGSVLAIGSSALGIALAIKDLRK